MPYMVRSVTVTYPKGVGDESFFVRHWAYVKRLNRLILLGCSRVPHRYSWCVLLFNLAVIARDAHNHQTKRTAHNMLLPHSHLHVALFCTV